MLDPLEQSDSKSAEARPVGPAGLGIKRSPIRVRELANEGDRIISGQFTMDEALLLRRH